MVQSVIIVGLISHAAITYAIAGVQNQIVCHNAQFVNVMSPNAVIVES